MVDELDDDYVPHPTPPLLGEEQEVENSRMLDEFDDEEAPASSGSIQLFLACSFLLCLRLRYFPHLICKLLSLIGRGFYRG